MLLIGDSIMDQQGSPAAFELRQAGIEAKAIGRWGTGLLTPDQYDHGKPNLSGGWLAIAGHQIATFDPDVVAVYMNHNFWMPHPTDANGHVIDDLWSVAGQQMIRAQANALITILQARGTQRVLRRAGAGRSLRQLRPDGVERDLARLRASARGAPHWHYRLRARARNVNGISRRDRTGLHRYSPVRPSER